MIGGLIKDYFHKRNCPKLLRQGIQVYLSEQAGVKKGETTFECPMCGSPVFITRIWRRYSTDTWKVDAVCPGCTLEVEKINSNKNIT